MGAKVCGKASNLGATAAIDLLKGSGLIIQDFMKKVETAVEPAAFGVTGPVVSPPEQRSFQLLACQKRASNR